MAKVKAKLENKVVCLSAQARVFGLELSPLFIAQVCSNHAADDNDDDDHHDHDDDDGDEHVDKFARSSWPMATLQM